MQAMRGILAITILFFQLIFSPILILLRPLFTYVFAVLSKFKILKTLSVIFSFTGFLTFLSNFLYNFSITILNFVAWLRVFIKNNPNSFGFTIIHIKICTI
jgi:hypothetical protein